MNVVSTEAATDSTSWRRVTRPRIERRTSSIACGFTARMTTDAPRTASALSSVVSIRRRAWSASRRSGCLAVATI